MYRRPKFLELLIELRQEMAEEADYDVELFAELARSGTVGVARRVRGQVQVDEQGVKTTRDKRRPVPQTEGVD